MSAPSFARVSTGRSNSRVMHSAPATARAWGTWRVCCMRPARNCTRSSWRGWVRLRRAVARSRLGPAGGDALGSSGPLLDAAAKAAYRQRLADLRSDLAEAEAWNDPERAERSQTEIDALTRELAAATGLGGRDRTAGSAAERARVSVTRAIRAALARIAEQSPALGSHFEATIRTGTYCSYHPDPRAPIGWQS